MDRLKDFIDTHRKAFDEEPLPEGFLERFEQKLPPARQRRGAMLYWGFALSVAASLAHLFLLRLPTETADGPLCNNSEREELRIYYQMQINEVMAQMNRLYQEGEAPGTKELYWESKRVLADNEMFEKTILPVLPCSNDGIFAMTQHYSGSLESLSLMLDRMRMLTERRKTGNEPQKIGSEPTTNS